MEEFRKTVDRVFSEITETEEGTFYRLEPMQGLIFFIPKSAFDSYKDTFIQTEGLFPVIVGAKMLINGRFKDYDLLEQIIGATDPLKDTEEYDLERILKEFVEFEEEDYRLYDTIITISGSSVLPQEFGIPLDEKGLIKIEFVNVVKPAGE